MRFPTKETIERLREMYPKGTRVELVSMDDPYTKLRPGDRGRTDFVDDGGTIHITWDSGSHLGAVYGVDQIKKVADEKERIGPAAISQTQRPNNRNPGQNRNCGR